MSKLREKFKPATRITRNGKLEDFSEQCEQISDDFAVKFAEWVSKHGWYFDKIEQKTHTLTELLQIFKTNHYEYIS